MQFYSLNRKSPSVSFEEATVRGQAPDGGLYFPLNVRLLPHMYAENLPKFSKEEIGVTVMKAFTGDTIPDDVLLRIVTETVDFPFPLKQVTDRIFSLELYHGPTLAFKDVGARFMSRCLGYFNRNNNRHTTVLVATSGDTGGAVANGFLGVPGIDVVILYPSGKVSEVQELQLTTCGENITALEINGTFDDCQRMVKSAFTDADITARLSLTSANSINVARWLPQQLYYYYACREWQHFDLPVFCVPSGNFGNLCAGLVAMAAGLPAKHFIAACNANDAVPKFFKNGEYHAQPSVATLSNAMDVGNPSNFIRVLELFNSEMDSMQKYMSAYTITDADTLDTIKKVNNELGYLLDPHGAVAFHAVEKYLAANPVERCIFLETAHPVKFPQAVELATGKKVELPDGVKELYNRKKISVKMDADTGQLKEWLLNRGV